VVAIVVGADMTKIDRFSNARHLVDITQEPIQVQIVADTMFIALKVGDVDRIKTDQRGP
jgi:hypothetical protein